MRHLWILFLLTPALGLVLAGCPTIDDDDSAVDDDDSSADDDDAADDDDSATDDDDAADDDDSSIDEPEPLVLDSVEIACVDEVVGTREQTSTWSFTARFEPGWAFDVVLMIWDQVPYEGYHYIDAWQPFLVEDNPEWGDDYSYDVWATEILGYSTIGEAQAGGDSIFRCYDSGGNEQIEEFNYMLCAIDLYWGDESCWFVGPDFGADAGTAASPVGTVGGYDDGELLYTATEDWLPGDAGSPFFFTPTNPD